VQLLCALMCLAGCLAAFRTGATEQTATFSVSAYVPPRLSIERLAGPAVLIVRPEDARAGYKDVTLRYVVRSNVSGGAIVHLTPRIGLTTSMTIGGLSQPLTLGEGDVEIWQTQNSELTLQVRFHLKDEVVPGTYPLPLVVWCEPGEMTDAR